MEDKQGQVVQLAPGDLQIFEQVSTRHDASVQVGVDPDELLKPAFWAHHASKLRPMDEIRARCQDGSWTAEYTVVACDRTWAMVALKVFNKLTTELPVTAPVNVQAIINEHTVVWRSPAHQWSVVRKSDKAVLQENMGTKDMANVWLESYARQQAGQAPEAIAA